MSTPIRQTSMQPGLSLFAILLLASTCPAAPLAVAFPKPGEWPAYRRDSSLQAHSPARGEITAPRIRWRQFVGVLESRVVVEPDTHGSQFHLPSNAVVLPSDSPDLAMKKFMPATGSGRNNELSATVIYADVLPEEPGQEKIEFESAFSIPTVNGQWQKSIGRCFAWRGGQWIQIWQTQPLDLLFQPLPLAGDFDGDGRIEIAILPFYELLLIDAQTGTIKDRCRFTDTRSYGFFGVYDFDHNGQSEFLIQADFSKHVDLLGFRDGKLCVLWQQVVEADISNPQKILRVGPNPVADVDGDGQAEVCTTIFNQRGDQRWRLTFHDALTGRVKAELPDEHLAAGLDLDGDGKDELLTTHTKGVGVPEFSRIQVCSFQESQFVALWQKEHSSWQRWEPPLPANVQTIATYGRTTVMSRRQANRVTVVLRDPMKSRASRVSAVQWEGGDFQTVTAVSGQGLEALGLDESNRLLVRARHAPGEAACLRIARGKAKLVSTQRLGGSVGPAVVAWPDQESEASIVVQGHGEEIVVLQPPRSAGKEAMLTRVTGRGQSTSWPESRGPVIADLDGDGRRQLLLATVSPAGCARLQATDLRGGARWHHDFVNIPGTPPVWNCGGIILWQTGHFTHSRRQDVLVTIRRSMMHSEETLLLGGKDGREIWRRDRQISQRGVGGTPFAIADYNGDGLDDAASLHPSILYMLQGSTGRDLLAQDTTWPEVPAKPVYWGQPIAGDFLGTTRPALFFGGRSMTGVVAATGALIWWDALDQSAQDWHAFGNFSGARRIEAIGGGYPDGLRCYDCATGKVLWHLPMPVAGAVVGSASADCDGDGRDEALFLIGQTLLCIGTSEQGTEGRVRWQLELPVATGPPSIATLGRNDDLFILLVGADGFVYAVR